MSRRSASTPRRIDVATAALALVLAVILVGVWNAALVYCPRAMRASARGATRAPPPPISEAELRSGDIVFVFFHKTQGRRAGGVRAPALVRQLANQVSMHAGVLMRHATHGLCFVDGIYNGKHAPGTLVPPTRMTSCAADVFQGASLRNGSVRATRWADFVRCHHGCIWVRRLRDGVAADEAAMWATFDALNADAHIVNGNLHDGGALRARLATWGARILTGAPLLDFAIGDSAATRISCLHTLLTLLQGGGLWPHVPHRLDGAVQDLVRAAAPGAPQRFRENLTRAGAAAADGAALGDCAAPIHGMPIDFASESACAPARLFWGAEAMVPCETCDPALF